MKLAKFTGIGAAIALALGFIFLLSFDEGREGPARRLLDAFNAPFAEREGAWNRAQREEAESFRAIGALGAPFTLTDQRGDAVSERDLRGRPVLLFFGYSRCGEPCERALGAIARALDELGPEGRAVTPVFVTLDPAYDTAARLEAYAAKFDPRLVALTGSEEAIGELADSYRVFFRRNEKAAVPGDLIDSSAYIFLLSAEGAYRGHFPPGAGGKALAAALRELL